MAVREEALIEKGYNIEDAPPASGLYTAIVFDGKTFYMSGMVPLENGSLKYKGKVPSGVSFEEAVAAAELCAANLLRVFIRDCGELDRIEKLIKVTGFVNVDDGYPDAHKIINGASALFLDVLGEAGAHARSAVGMAALPIDACVEVELIGTIR